MKAMKKTMIRIVTRLTEHASKGKSFPFWIILSFPLYYPSFQTSTHVCLITDSCPGGELFALLEIQPMKFLSEESAIYETFEKEVGKTTDLAKQVVDKIIVYRLDCDKKKVHRWLQK
ncbi:Phototropin-2 [Raphanus sativus]|nr:Phototropin-2 [Raphanus sativus]